MTLFLLIFLWLAGGLGWAAIMPLARAKGDAEKLKETVCKKEVLAIMVCWPVAALVLTVLYLGVNRLKIPLLHHIVAPFVKALRREESERKASKQDMRTEPGMQEPNPDVKAPENVTINEGYNAGGPSKAHERVSRIRYE